jgi:hypothetical protein
VTFCLVPIGLLPLILGIFEILYAVKLLADPPRPVQPSQTIAILEICCILFGNIISLVVGILALVFYNDPDVKAYFERINGQRQPALAKAVVSKEVKPVKQASPVKKSAVVRKSPAVTPTPKVTEARKPGQARPKKTDTGTS